MTAVTGIYCEKSRFGPDRKWVGNFIGNKAAASSRQGRHVPIVLHMLRHDKSAPIWLFSFVDLAFLLLIAFTQIGPEVTANDPAIGQIEIPQLAEVDGPTSPLEHSEAAPTWQLRVYPTAQDDSRTNERTPFELIEPGAVVTLDLDRVDALKFPNTRPGSKRIDAAELISHLRLLHDRRLAKPILAPHRDSRSEDLLVAVGLLQEVWQAGRAVAVAPRPAVASGPGNDDPERQ